MDYLITPQQIIDITLADKSFDKSFFKNSFIEVAQEGDIRPVLGDDLFDEIISQNTGDELTENNQSVVDRIKPALAFFILGRVIPFINVDITSLGLRVNVSETSQSASSSQRADLQKCCFDMAQVYIDSLIRYIEHDDNIDKYPLYDVEDNVENSHSIIGGIILGDE